MDDINILLQEILPHSKQFTDFAYYVDKKWLVITEDAAANTHDLIFQTKDNELIQSGNGKVYKGKWKYLDYAKTLLLEKEEGNTMYNLGFMNNRFFILKKQGTDSFLFLANENEFKDKNRFEIIETLKEEYLLQLTSTSSIEGTEIPEELRIKRPNKPLIFLKKASLSILAIFKRYTPIGLFFAIPLWLASNQMPPDQGAALRFWTFLFILVATPLFVMSFVVPFLQKLFTPKKTNH